MILILKNVSGSYGCHKTGKLLSQTIDTQQVGVPFNGTINRQTTSQHLGNRCRQVPLKIGGRMPGGATQHGQMEVVSEQGRAVLRSDFIFFSPSLRTEEISTGGFAPR